MKTEARLKSAFAKELKRQLPAYLMLHYSTAGAPDCEIVGNGVTSRWEAKHATPDFTSHDNQVLMAMRLAAMAHCRYVVWYETRRGDGKMTMIVHPKQVHEHKGTGSSTICGITLIPEAWCDGFNHGWLVEQVRKVHQA